MELAVSEVYEGKVTGITKFGAFVLLPNGKSGLVHISEVANAFVSDVHEHVQIGQSVKVKLLSISEEGKINHQARAGGPAGDARPGGSASAHTAPASAGGVLARTGRTAEQRQPGF